MKIFFQAIQAVTVEFCGVAIVVWLLFGFASFGLRTAGIGNDEATSRKQPQTRVASHMPRFDTTTHLSLVTSK